MGVMYYRMSNQQPYCLVLLQEDATATENSSDNTCFAAAQNEIYRLVGSKEWIAGLEIFFIPLVHFCVPAGYVDHLR